MAADGGGDRRPARYALASGILNEPADSARGTDKWSDHFERHIIVPESLEQSILFRVEFVSSSEFYHLVPVRALY